MRDREQRYGRDHKRKMTGEGGESEAEREKDVKNAAAMALLTSSHAA